MREEFYKMKKELSRNYQNSNRWYQKLIKDYYEELEINKF
jgi:hypothetical protein